MHESNCMLISNCVAYFGVSFYKKKNHRVLPSCVCSSLAGAEIQKNSVLNWKTNCEVIINDKNIRG